MSDVLPPLGDMTLEEAARRRGELLRALSSGALSVRNTDGSAVTYRNMAEMKTAVTEIERWITAATASAVGAVNPLLAPVRTLRFTPFSGFR